MCIPDLCRATHALWKPREPALRMRTFKHLRQKISNKGPKEFTYLTKTQEQIWDLDPLKIQRPHTPNPGHLILRIKTLEQKLKTLAVLFLNKGPQITQSESLERSSYRKYRDLTQWMETPPQTCETSIFGNGLPQISEIFHHEQRPQTQTPMLKYSECKLKVTSISNLTVQNLNTSEPLYCAHRSSNAPELILNPWIMDHRESKDLVTWSQTSNSPRVKLQNRNSQMIKDFTARWNPKWFQWDLWDTNWTVTDPTHLTDLPKHLTFKTWQTQHSLFLIPYFNLLLISFLGFEVGPTVILCRV